MRHEGGARWSGRPAVLLAVLLVLVLGGAVALRGWVLPGPAAPPPPTEVVQAQPLITVGGGEDPAATTRQAPALNSGQQALVRSALDLMQQHRTRIREGWEIRDCAAACDRDSLAETYPETRRWHCVTYLAWPNLRAAAQEMGTPLVRVTAWVLVHEQVHCDDDRLRRGDQNQAERVAEAEALRFAERLGDPALTGASRDYLASIGRR